MSKELQKNNSIFNDIKALIDDSRQDVAVAINSTMTTLYWQIGKRIKSEILKDRRAEYGKQIIVGLSGQLQSNYGSGWSEKQLRHCLRFAEIIPDAAIVSALRRQLSWTHIKTLIYIEDDLKRMFLDRLHKAVRIARSNLCYRENENE